MKIPSILPPREVLPTFSPHKGYAEAQYRSSIVSLRICNPFQMLWQWIISFFCYCKKKSLTPQERAAELTKFKDFVRDRWDQKGNSYGIAWSQLDPITRQALIEKCLAALREKATHSGFQYSSQELFDGAIDLVSDPLSPGCDIQALVMDRKDYHTCAKELLLNLIDQVASDGAP